MYQAGPWDYPRRVVFKIEKPYGQLMHMYTFIVTNMDMEPYQIIQFYCGRSRMTLSRKAKADLILLLSAVIPK